MTPAEKKASELANVWVQKSDGSIGHCPECFKAGFLAALELAEVKGLEKALSSLRKADTVGADGTRIKCTCGKENCIDIWCSAGDEIFINPYYNENGPDQALTAWRSFRGEK